MKLPAYPRTKPSGVEWLGDVPEHWEVKRLKRAAHLTDKKVEADEENPVPYIGMENIESWTGRLLPINTEVVPTGTANAFKAGHTLFGKLRPYLAKACTPDFDGLCSNELLVLDGVEFDRDSLRYALLCGGFINLVDSSTYGSKMPRASWDFIGNCVLPIAPPSEQRAIAAFLDRETGRVDRLVAKKRELIERLKEKRTALISRTVTRGLPAETAAKAGLPVNPPLKPSGHPWLVDVPMHWDVKRVKEIALLVGRIGFRGYSTEDLVYEGEGAISMSPSNMVDGSISLDKCTWLSWEKYHESPEIQLQPEDVVMVKTGSTLGKTAFVKTVPVPMTINPQLMIFKEVKCSNRFLFYFVSSNVVQDVIPLHNTGSTIPTMTQEGIGKLPFPHPPLPEQAAIAAYLDAETAKLDALVGKVEEAVERLQEHRTALITAAVTGKIDVRQAALDGRA